MRYKKKPKKVNIVKAGWFLKDKYISTSKLTVRLDKVFSKYKRLSALTSGGYIRCFTCRGFFTFRQIDCGHFVSRTYMSTRFLEKNTACQCRRCNRFKEGVKDVFALELQKKYGKDILVWLNDKKNEIKQYSVDELLRLIDYYRQKVKELEKSNLITSRGR